jgi:Big-like domain-containing protein
VIARVAWAHIYKTILEVVLRVLFHLAVGSVLLVSTFSFAQTITIISPVEGATTSPVRVVADFSDAGSIAATTVLVDGAEVIQGGAVTPLDVTIPISPGSHQITVKAVGDDGKEISASRAVDVTAPEVMKAAATAGSITSDSTSSTLSYSKIEEKSGWYTAPDQGSPYCSSKPTLVDTPSLDGISGKFYLQPKGQFNNCLWPILLGKSTTATHFQLDVHYRLSNPAYPQGVEFSSNKHVGTKWYKFSVQCSYNKGVFSMYDPVKGAWSATSIPCKRPTAGKWDHLIVNSEISNGKSVFQSIVFNGVTHTINKSFGPITKSSSYNFGVHFQMDGNRAGNPYYTWIDQLSYKAW